MQFLLIVALRCCYRSTKVKFDKVDTLEVLQLLINIHISHEHMTTQNLKGPLNGV
jgi:hypothetical protein